MFPSELLTTAIQTDRVRDLERRSREQRLLQSEPVEWTDVPDSVSDPGATLVPFRRSAPALPRTGRSAGSACEAV